MLVLTLTLSAGVGDTWYDNASASHAGGADEFGIDMNPNLISANTATSVSTQQTCGRIDRNGLQDADEDAVDALVVDLTVTNVPASAPMMGFMFTIAYNEGVLSVKAGDPNFFVTAQSGSNLFNANDATPDTNGNGVWHGAALDILPTTTEYGSGILERVTIGADPGAASGIYALTLQDSAHIDGYNNLYTPDALLGATVAIGGSYCPNTDSDGDGVYDADEANCGSNVYNATRRPERLDGTFATTDDDGDTLVNEALPGGSSGFDCDGDGYKGSAEGSIFVAGARDQDSCGNNGWPPELVSGGVTQNKVTIQDSGSFFAPTYRFNTSPGAGGFDARWDLIPGPAVPGGAWINSQDYGTLFAGPTSTPPMLGGAAVFNGPVCPWPP